MHEIIGEFKDMTVVKIMLLIRDNVINNICHLVK